MQTQKKLISTSSRFEREMAFSRAVVVENMVFVSGCTGYDYAADSLPEDVVTQTEQTFQNIIYALKEAGASLQDVVRVTYIIPNPADIPLCAAVMRTYFQDVLPACTCYCAPLVNDALKIEIEVTAIKSK
ncbi:RidA family protein [Fluviicola taffensis]|uniref:Endoribonuclease L-PSP n=1 Tax=Fluviicola taffensis (strain DSM 16823 / NCIMB 13979 / RW262) TaxID=755732 RepID=F2I9T6_FLUTR|nr:RidA family protein [Fluviicola taffensis]AEA43082.1 Endoribonuclease L-PSP [Fluviicola taffensis DSM 16823]